MLSLPELSEKYKNLYPEYIDPLAKFSPGDPRLASIKQDALSPYLSSLEEEIILYNDQILVSAFLFDVEVNENGFIAEVWKIKTRQLPYNTYPFKEKPEPSNPTGNTFAYLGTEWTACRMAGLFRQKKN